MARSRIIKPSFFKNEILAEMPPLDRLFFAGLWTQADRAGRLEYRPKRLKNEILPWDEFDVENGIRRLAAESFLSLYMADGKMVIQIANWDKHQSPHHKEIVSVLPSMDEARAKHGPSMTQASGNENGSCPTRSCSSSFSSSSSSSEEESKAKGAQKTARLELPEWLSPAAWAEWDEFRCKLGKKAWTDNAKRLTISKLTKLRAAGNDPQTVIRQSIERGYRGLFELKPFLDGGPNGRGRGKGVADRISEIGRAPPDAT